ncbi:hypothetical protein ARMSODRAFT_1084878 [Armillaria solidipes]|uniref:F-box domain-containing protein n=1 Tax=Armillaria solidipes TaxID=1076256 RepID=A0A2H3BFH0_9AGAR|nr:hypothetical protein ARMSODRAFT_1084878 [Armillaria solidipes]
MQSTLEEILARHDWISTFTHPSDVLALLRTNDAPSPPQSARLKASFEGLQTALAELQSNLDLLHNVAASLQTQMSCLLSLKHDYETVLSPMRRIPSEIAMEILCRSWKDAEFSDTSLGRRPAGFNVFRIREGPWHLGQVCSSWRNVIETLCPELWATMIVNLRVSFPYERLFGNLVEILRIVLERSRNHPLSFSFRFHGTEMEESGIPEIEQCFDTMITHSKRWKAVDLTIPSDLVLRLSRIRGKIDWLTENLQHGDIHAFEIAPALEQLHLKGIHQVANIHFPTSNLVSFSDARSFAGDRLTPEYLHIIKSSPKLRSFSYNDYGVQSLDILPLVHPPIMSPSVEELSASSPMFMRSLVLPSLKDVTLSTNAHEKDMEEEVMSCPVGALGALHEMLLQSRCSLSRLCLVDVVLDDHLTNIIRLMPGLQEFMINFNEWVDDYDPIMQSLVTQLSEVSLVDGTRQHSVVPSLQSLHVYLFNVRYSHVSFINSAFVDMVASRLRRPSDAPRLTEFDLHMSGLGGSSDLDEEAENVLASLKDEGLRLNYYIQMYKG